MKPLLLTPGDPRGVGPELSLLACSRTDLDVVLLGDIPTLKALEPRLKVVSTLEGSGIRALQLEEGEEPIEVSAIRKAVELCLRGEARAMVTGPIHKARLRARGFLYSGHTDFLGALCKVPEPVMAFVGAEDRNGHPVRVALVTVHIPLSRVSAALTIENVLHTLKMSHDTLKKQLHIERPRLAVCGLNPHAGEEGVLGDEELRVIGPACEKAREEGISVWGPVSAETAFLEVERADMIVAMYHDQGLVPLKALGFGKSVNWSLGLPIVRTSVDHGTADALVGTGRASPDSMVAALRWADTLTRPQ